MNEINIAKTLIAKRRAKGITQEELAAYIGVTKASVSKWETGQSYPDITYLPQLAAYFNISVDDLLGYSPQMTKEDIKTLYHELASKFAEQPFAEVIAECRFIIKKYYSCFPLLLQMAILLLNHHMLTPDKKLQEAIIQELLDLCQRVKKESDDVWINKEAVTIEATCYLMTQKPQLVLDLFGEELRPIPQDTEMIAQSYQMMGNTKKAKEVVQISMYQHLLFLVSEAQSDMMLNTDHLEKVDETLRRTLGTAELYNLDSLHPNTMAQVYYVAAHVYCLNNQTKKALAMLQRYADVCVSDFFPYSLHGDDYFDAIENWFEDFELGVSAPRSEKVIKESMIQSVLSNPVFASLADDPKYKNIVNKLTENLGGNQ
ncbi:helix-turn-helix domain-containing protein [Acetobacterium tundrae]|uniref:Helix-turn-helix domain-containing protein n=1 Tax=Acetobacterium tundrae TaxID=132932 RepID=A0ABR6WGJ9_9FIRM|nr:helix-turn-helix transcriptional regulator [Acetobacterium tundrae]MBC3795614.1 helix-turn-helix domain-containing protein [Acetobacterium tundrae]